MGRSLAVILCVLSICGTAHAEPQVPLTLRYVPEQRELLLGSLRKLDVMLARYRRPPELKLQPFNALRGGLRTNEYEDHRRAQRLLARSDLGQRAGGAQVGVLDGDLASVASLAATYVSFNLTLRPKRKLPRFFLEPDATRRPWAVGLGLGRVGLALKTEF